MSRSDGIVRGLVAALVAAALISPFLRDLYAGDESRYARIAAEMERSGEWAVPLLDGRPYSDKPPLHFWMLIGSARLLGWDRTWSFVLPSILFFLLTVGLVARAAARWYGRAAAPWAALVMASSILAWGSAQTARMDMTYAFLGTLAGIWVREAFEERRGWKLLAAGAACGAAILVKGPAVLVLCVLLALVAWRLERAAMGWSAAGAVAVAAAMPLVWLSFAARAGGTDYAFDLLFTQNVGRAVDSWAHAKPAWYYLARLPLLWFPWIVAAVAALAAGFRSERGPLRYAAIWTTLVVLFYSLVSGKLDVYLLASIPPLALAVGGWIATDRPARSVVAGNAALLGVTGLASAAAAAGWWRRFVPEPELALFERAPAVPFFAAVAIAAIAAAVWSLRQGTLAASMRALGAATAAALFAGALFFAPLFDRVNSSRPLLDALDRHGLSGRSVALYEAFHPWGRGFAFDAPEVFEADAWTLRRTVPDVVVTRDSRATELGPRLRSDYRKVERVRIRRKNYDVYVLASPSERVAQ